MSTINECGGLHEEAPSVQGKPASVSEFDPNQLRLLELPVVSAATEVVRSVAAILPPPKCRHEAGEMALDPGKPIHVDSCCIEVAVMSVDQPQSGPIDPVRLNVAAPHHRFQ